MVIDYCALNAILVKDRFPLPYLEELIDQLQGKKWFNKIDFWSECHQNRVSPADVEKTAFVGPDGLFEWLVIPQGIATAPAWFMRIISEVLEKHKQYCVVFLNDVLILPETQEEHESHVRKVLESIRLHNFLLKEKKCSFFAQEVNFLGFDIGKDSIKIMEERFKAIVE